MPISTSRSCLHLYPSQYPVFFNAAISPETHPRIHMHTYMFTYTTFLSCNWWMSLPLLPMTVPFSKFLLWGLLHDHTEHISLSSPLVFKSLLKVNSSTIFPCSFPFTLVIFPHLPDSVYDLLDCNVTLSKFKYEVLHVPI